MLRGCESSWNEPAPEHYREFLSGFWGSAFYSLVSKSMNAWLKSHLHFPFMTAERVQVMPEVFCSAEEQGFLHTTPSKDMPDNMNCAWIHVSPDAGATTYMYEFQYHPSFSSDSKPKTVMGDHGDELYSVFGAPILRGNSASLPVCWWLRSGFQFCFCDLEHLSPLLKFISQLRVTGMS